MVLAQEISTTLGAAKDLLVVVMDREGLYRGRSEGTAAMGLPAPYGGHAGGQENSKSSSAEHRIKRRIIGSPRTVGVCSLAGRTAWS